MKRQKTYDIRVFLPDEYVFLTPIQALKSVGIRIRKTDEIIFSGYVYSRSTAPFHEVRGLNEPISTTCPWFKERCVGLGVRRKV